MDNSKPSPQSKLPFKPKTQHPTAHRKIIDGLVKRSVYVPPKTPKPAPEIRAP